MPTSELFVHSAVHVCFPQHRRVTPAVPLRHEDLRIKRALLLCHHHVIRAMAAELEMNERQQRELQPSSFETTLARSGGSYRRRPNAELIEMTRRTLQRHKYFPSRTCNEIQRPRLLRRVCRQRNQRPVKQIPLELLPDAGKCNNRASLNDHRWIAVE